MMRLPKVKDVHRPVRALDGRILIGGAVSGVASEIVDDRNGLVWRLLELMDGSREPEAIVTALQAEQPALDPSSAMRAIETVIQCGFVEDAGAPVPSGLSETELERYSRSTQFFAWADVRPRSSPHEIQRRLKDARVAVVGVGGSGSALAASLAAVGVGRIACFDCDLVETSNLNRQLLYDERDLGRSKVECAIERLRRLNSEVVVDGGELRVAAMDDLAPIMSECDLLALCADTPPGQIQSWTNEMAMRTRTPWLVAMHGGPMTITGIYVPHETPCFECTAQFQRDQLVATWGATGIPRAPLTPAIAPTSAIAGHLGALEAIYFLGGLRPRTVGRLFYQNLLEYDHSFFFRPDFWDACPVCGVSGRYPRPASDAVAAEAEAAVVAPTGR
jgi:molybdopterin/thiamine biosynthesis adenylyltransferase